MFQGPFFIRSGLVTSHLTQLVGLGWIGLVALRSTGVLAKTFWISLLRLRPEPNFIVPIGNQNSSP
jgi:hypothetical protein